jgi:hypothetical protein
VITLKDFMQTVDYKITEGSDFCWDCYGSNAYTLSYWNQDHAGHGFSIIFNTRTHSVYEVQAHDYKHNRAYRLISPAYQLSYAAEARVRDIPYSEAWDDVNYVDLETDEDFLDKARLIISGEDYDTRIDVPLRMDDDALFELMKKAHERDITLNQLIEEVLRNVIAVHETGTDNSIDFPIDRQGPAIQEHPFPADNFTQEQAREAVKKAKRKKSKK